MRERPGAANRVALILVGVVIILAGAAGLLIALGFWAPTLAAVTGWSGPDPSGSLLPAGADPTTARTASWPIALAVAAGLLLLTLAVAWWTHLVPRRRATSVLQLHDAEDGTTMVARPVLAAAIEADCVDHPDVERARVLLRGEADQPSLTVVLTVRDSTDVPRLLTDLRTRLEELAATVLDAQLARLAVQIEVTRTPGRQHSVVL